MRKLSLFVLFITTSISFLISILFIWNSDDLFGRDKQLYESKKRLKHLMNGHPNIVWYKSDMLTETKHCLGGITCNFFNDKGYYIDVKAFLFYASDLNFMKLSIPRDPEVIWALLHDESPRNVPELMHEDILNLFNVSSTFSRYSDVPFPLQALGSIESIISTEYFVETSVKNSLLKDIAPIMYLQSDCDTSTERDAYVKELMKYINIDSYGICLNNKALPESLTEDYLNKLNSVEFLRFVARYKFIIAIENGVCEDYVTEKFWRGIIVGSVPIYFGSPSIKDWMPNNKSAILLQDYPTPKLLSEQIYKLMGSDTLYEQYLEHKTKGIVQNKKLYEEVRIRPYQLDFANIVEKFECFVCKKLYDLKKRKETYVVKKSHYDCPKPISALTLDVNPLNGWANYWETTKVSAKKILKQIRNKL